jgi:hypothetical protein
MSTWCWNKSGLELSLPGLSWPSLHGGKRDAGVPGTKAASQGQRVSSVSSSLPEVKGAVPEKPELVMGVPEFVDVGGYRC